MKIPLFHDQRETLLFAHRGCSTQAPENTLPAFRAALERGIFGIELDIRRCATGELVVIHDGTVDRTTDGSGRVEEMPLEALRGLDAGSWFGGPDSAPRFRDTRIPLLEEVFDLCGHRVYYDIEIKYFKRRESRIPKALIELIVRYGLEDRVMVSSFNPLVLRSFRHITPRIPTALIFAKHQEVPFYLRRGEGRRLVGCDALKPKFDQVTVRSAARWGKREGYPLLPWTVDDADEAERLIGLGARGIISNTPETLPEKPVSRKPGEELFPELPP